VTIDGGQLNNPGSSLGIIGSGIVTFLNGRAGNSLIGGHIVNFLGNSSAEDAVIILAPQVNFSGTSSGGNSIIASGGGVIDISNLSTAGTTVGSLVGDNQIQFGGKELVVGGNNLSSSANLAFLDNGSLVKVGTGTLTAFSSGALFTGTTTVLEGGLLVDFGVVGNVAVGTAGLLGAVTDDSFPGAATVHGDVVNNGIVALAGNTLAVTGNYKQTATGTYLVGITPTQNYRLNITGTATLGGSVAVLPASGAYARNTTYTVLSATGGLVGSFSGVTGTIGLLTPTLTYDTQNVFLSLTLPANAFAAAGRTANQRAVGGALDQAAGSATGDFANVINTVANLSSTQAAAVMDMVSGQSYAGFSSVAVFGAQNFMNAFSQQAGGGQGGGSIALAEACDVACDVGGRRWGAWGGGTGAFGTLAGDSNAPGLTYNLGGFAAGLDYRFSANLLAGVTVGYNAATLYPQGTSGQGTVGTVQLGLYGEYTDGPLYVDGLAGYARSENRMLRQIVVPGLNLRTAWGQTHADQLFGQLEVGYKLAVAPGFGGFVTPFARMQGSTSTQAGFTESGADSLNLVVASQTTNSLRSVLGAQLGAAIDAGWHDKLDLVFRLGWSHEYADINRPVSAAFAGAPAITFTTQSAGGRATACCWDWAPGQPSPRPPASTCATTATWLAPTPITLCRPGCA
jgi:outer membrane autotransporter protein